LWLLSERSANGPNIFIAVAFVLPFWKSLNFWYRGSYIIRVPTFHLLFHVCGGLIHLSCHQVGLDLCNRIVIIKFIIESAKEIIKHVVENEVEIFTEVLGMIVGDSK